MKRKKRRKTKFLLRLIIVVILLAGIALVGYKMLSKTTEEAPKVVDSIDNFMYTLEDRDTALMKSTYNELKDILTKSDVDMEAYATNLAKLFIIDLFTIDNKRNKYDVGGSEYVYPDAAQNFKLNAEDTIYKLVKTNTDGKRKQELPIVKSVTIKDVKKDTFTIGEDKKYDCFILDVSWEYERDLGYDKKALVTVIIDGDKAYIVEYSVGE